MARFIEVRKQNEDESILLNIERISRVTRHDRRHCTLDLLDQYPINVRGSYEFIVGVLKAERWDPPEAAAVADVVERASGE